MDIVEIITDSLIYPINNLKALVLYAVLGIIAALVLALTGVGVSAGTAVNNAAAAGITGILGVVVAFIIFLLIDGYSLDIVKFGVNKDSGAPGIDFTRQVVNGIKLIIVNVVYYIVPILLTFILRLFLAEWLASVIGIILVIIFALAEFTAECRLAKTDDLGSALAIGEAIGDISRVGIVKLLVTVIIIAIISGILTAIVRAIAQFNVTVGAILLGILGVYVVFFSNRATGLLYSDV